MPIDIEEFEAVAGDEGRSTSERIVEFLLENRDAAFTRGEITAAIDCAPNTVGTNLSRLKEREFVRHRGHHWAITNNLDRLTNAVRFSVSQLDDEYGSLLTSEKDAEAWNEAQPDQQHPSEEGNEDDSNQLERDAVEETSD